MPQKTVGRVKTESRLKKQLSLEKTIKIEHSEGGGGLTKFFLFLLLLAGGIYGADQAGFDTLGLIENLAKQAGVNLPQVEEVAVKPQTEFKIAKKQIAAPVVNREVPSYAFGDEFVYAHEVVNGKGIKINSDQIRYAVVGTVGNQVRWNIAEKINLVSSTNPFLGEIEELVIYQESGRSPSSVAFVESGMSFFPLTQGGKLELSRGGAPGEGYACVVGEAERLTVPAGEFDTVRVNCQTSGGVRSREEVFHFAPSVGHWVARRTLYKSGEFQRTDTYQLVSFARAK
jgi:hypothetical protein